MMFQLLQLLSPKRKSSNNQCCNNSQLDNPNYPCFRPSNPLLCHHNFYPHNPFKPHHCHRRKLYNLPSLTSSLRLRRRNAHRRYRNGDSRLFQKKMRLLDRDVQKSRLRTFLRLKELQEAAYLRRWSSWDEEDEKILIQILMNDLETYLEN